ncbi:terminase family protein, partial [Azotobacter chroococcum]|nr:terminase family protein [Azotobacter chroococcum]
MKTGNLLLDRQLARWYALKEHPVQLELINAVPSGIRFPLVPAGRRSGKTERFKRFLVKQASAVHGIYFAAAPTHDQAKKIFWDDLKAFTLSCTHSRRPSESDRIIYMESGSEIHVIGLDKPQRIEGIPWTGGGIDEFADIKPDAWEA